MAKTLAEFTGEELEQLIERAVDRRMRVWFQQMVDAINGPDEDEAELRPEFAEELRRSLEQARTGDVVDLRTVRERLGL